MSSLPVPPRFVPTLTEVVHPASVLAVPAVPFVSDNKPPIADTPHSVEILVRQFEDQLLHRVMQRVDLVLERRLREAISQIILTHTQALGPRLREEIELVVRESVSQAIAQELPLSAVSD